MPGDKPASEQEHKYRVLIDKQEIHDVLVRYCFGIDRGDLALILSAFHDDALDNHTGVEERAVDRFTRTVGQARSMSMLTSHNLGNIFIEVAASTASSQSYFTASHRFDIDGQPYDWVITGRYLDRFERRNGDWRIAHRTVVYDFERYDKVGPKPMNHPTAALLEHAMRGVRSREDFSYNLFGTWGSAR